MNAAFLLLTSAVGAGGDVIPAGWGERPPAIIQAGGCSACAPAPACGTCGDPCKSPCPSLLDKIKARLASKKSCCSSAPSCCSAPAPTCCPPAPAPTCDCDPCAKKKIGLLDKIKARLASKKSCCASSCDTGCGGCAAAPAVIVPANPTTPKEMPKVDPKADPKKAGAAAPIPVPNPVSLPPLPVTPSSGVKVSGANSPY
ncbi:MAG: hypothetical protein U0792_02980 [Gemmataceae bacterium]